MNPQAYVKPAFCLMYWAAIWQEDRTEIILMYRDPLAKKFGYSSWSYKKALREGLLPALDGTCHFVQDNAGVHTAKNTSEWLQAHTIEYINWPSHSPDLNPIENIWRMLKAKLRKNYPYLVSLKNNRVDKQELHRCIKLAWKELDQARISRVIGTMKKRLEAVIHA